ncbi:MAG: hypothetical protein SOR81_02320 [Fusobacterium sp.]|uniref:hypothetical protein n=1 Tax=Fusobacterium sp. TaxID=68766 RepID=UPI002A752C99|nr:hypothetical protein [Fusobacterium sp.]MDY2980425.1 hypothetical protein [Fusobacterium sp.]
MRKKISKALPFSKGAVIFSMALFIFKTKFIRFVVTMVENVVKFFLCNLFKIKIIYLM